MRFGLGESDEYRTNKSDTQLQVPLQASPFFQPLKGERRIEMLVLLSVGKAHKVFADVAGWARTCPDLKIGLLRPKE